jgi:hypothetical protein
MEESVFIGDIFPGVTIEKGAVLKKVILLSTHLDSKYLVKEIKKDEAANKIMANNMRESIDFWSLLQAYSYSNNISPEDWFNRERDILTRALKGVVCHELLLPPKGILGEKDIDKIEEVIDE